MKIYRDKDADLTLLKDRSIVIIGYGNQGTAFAHNLRDSGFDVAIALRSPSKSASIAVDDGFPVVDNADAVAADLLLFMLPDHLHGEFFKEHLEGKLRKGQVLVFAHGYSVHFGLIDAPSGVSCLLVAPHGPGSDLRDRYLDKTGLSCFVAAHPKNSGKPLHLAVAIAAACGCTRAGAFKTSFENETIGDLFGEQALLCGGLSHLILSVFDTLVDNGIPPENAYLETANQLDLLARLIREYGIAGMMDRVSLTAQFGTVTAEKVLGNKALRSKLQRLCDDVKSGSFSKRWAEEYKRGYPKLDEFKKSLRKSLFEITSRKMRKLLED